MRVWLGKALAAEPNFIEPRVPLAILMHETGRRDEALKLIDGVLAQVTDHPIALLWRCILELPILYHDQGEVALCRERYTAALGALAPMVEQEPKRFLCAFGTNLPFYLAYQGEDDRELQTLYGSLLEKVVRSNVPLRPPERFKRDKIRVGIISRHFRYHSVWKIPTRGWLVALDRNVFEVFCYYTDNIIDDQTMFARENSERFVQGPISLALRGF